MVAEAHIADRILKIGLTLLLLAVVSGPLGFVVWFFSTPFFAPAGSYRAVVDDPEITGLNWPAGATILSVQDSHGGFNGDGELHIIFAAEPAALSEWMHQSPPWKHAAWLRGPVPTEIVSHCWYQTSDGPQAKAPSGGFAPKEAWNEISHSDEVRYVAREVCCESIEWHNGDLLVIDPANNRVWLSVWDF